MHPGVSVSFCDTLLTSWAKDICFDQVDAGHPAMKVAGRSPRGPIFDYRRFRAALVDPPVLRTFCSRSFSFFPDRIQQTGKIEIEQLPDFRVQLGQYAGQVNFVRKLLRVCCALIGCVTEPSNFCDPRRKHKPLQFIQHGTRIDQSGRPIRLRSKDFQSFRINTAQGKGRMRIALRH